MITRANILYKLYKIATEGTIKSILGFKPDIAKLISERFGRRAFLYAKWFKEYLEKHGLNIEDLDFKAIQHGMIYFDNYMSNLLNISGLKEYHIIDDDEMLDLLNPFVTIFEKGTLYNKFKGMSLEEAEEKYKEYFINHSKVKKALGSIKWRGELHTEINGSIYHFKDVGEECGIASILLHNCGQIISSDFGSEGEYFNSVDMTMHLIIKDSSKVVGVTTSGYINGYSHPQGDLNYKNEIDGKFIINAEGPAKRKIRDADTLLALDFFIEYNNLTPAIVFDYRTGKRLSNLVDSSLLRSGSLTNIWIQSEDDRLKEEYGNEDLGVDVDEDEDDDDIRNV